MHTLITGGAGFIGTNLAARLAGMGRRVVLYDSLVRAGAERNLRWLRQTAGPLVTHVQGDVRDAARVAAAMRDAETVFHLAAQVAVTHSLTDPMTDFAVNAVGTLHVLEAVRACPTPPRLVFTSTNKVYGDLGTELALSGPTAPSARPGPYGQEVPPISWRRRDHDAAPEPDPALTRWEPVDPFLRQHGVPETQPLDFRSPYGCSKGAADQYVRDYARSYGLPAVVFRMSCVYGPHQCGNEDQGWLAHFARRAPAGEPITLYGDGKQVRDALYVDDLVEALLLAEEHAPQLAGQAFNLGGGPEHTTSLLELLALLQELTGRPVHVKRGEWRTGDQRWYVSDCRRFRQATDWQACTPLRRGVSHLLEALNPEKKLSRNAETPHRDPR